MMERIGQSVLFFYEDQMNKLNSFFIAKSFRHNSSVFTELKLRPRH
jgi:hypothetical protein